MKYLNRTFAAGAFAASALVGFSSPTSADILHNDDVIIFFSLCVGNDCVNGESFGFDTIRLKENNLRIHFQDTSSTASFPTNDWRIMINDSSNGGGNYFAIEDSNAARQVFRVDAGARTNSIRVDSQGDVGFGSATPVVNLHAVDGNTPTLRLEQDGSSGFTPQTWDLAGNETNFFIRDATNGSALPFRIRPGADSNSIYVDNDNDVGLQTSSPAENLHMRDTSGTFFGIRLEDASSGGTGSIWRVLADPRVNRDQFLITKAGTGAAEMVIDSGGDVTILGTMTTGGATCGGGCDRVFTAEYELPSIEAHASDMWENGFLPNIGPTIENEPLNVSDKVGRMLNELETAHIYIEQLNERIAVIDESNAQLAILVAQLVEQTEE
jgi:hypothetical protein